MGYIDRLLESGEEVLHRSRLPRAAFLIPLVFLAAAVPLLINRNLGIGTLSLILGAISGIYAGVMYASAEYAVTNRRVLARVGFRDKVPWAVPFGDIQEVRVDQGALGRLLNFGTVHVKDTEGTTRSMEKLANPRAFVREIEERSKPAATAQA